VLWQGLAFHQKRETAQLCAIANLRAWQADRIWLQGRAFSDGNASDLHDAIFKEVSLDIR
jgi:hypothetical protein